MDENEGSRSSNKTGLSTFRNLEVIREEAPKGQFRCLGEVPHDIVCDRNPGVCPECDADVSIAPFGRNKK